MYTSVSAIRKWSPDSGRGRYAGDPRLDARSLSCSVHRLNWPGAMPLVTERAQLLTHIRSNSAHRAAAVTTQKVALASAPRNSPR